MSLKRRNIIAISLILIAAVCWAFGRQMIEKQENGYPTATTAPREYREGTLYPTTIRGSEPGDGRNTDPSTVVTMPADGGYADTAPTAEGIKAEIDETDHRTERMLGYVLSFAAVAAGVIAVFVLSQKDPVFGPDGICLIGGISVLAYETLPNMDFLMWSDMYDGYAVASSIVKVFLILLLVREGWGWIMAGLPMQWCLVQRITLRFKRPQYALIFSAGWIAAAGSFVACLLFTSSPRYGLFPGCCFAGAAILGTWQLWRYGADLHHFKTQLNNFQQGLPITVSKGTFSQTEAQLLEVQAQHEEAVRTAVTSERFKVELISNVSHDLRTPLTSILGYSELLQNEALSPDGQEQLRRLHQKAGYMNDLVESLFELTKVSSGVVESKKEQIDLVRLMEQTIGLFDDQLVGAELVVKRSYCADTIPAVTDGARMHQVFANLLGNAIKYALAGTRIYVEVKETDCSYLIRMMNTASYEMDFRPDEIMQRFARGDKARSTKGSGLGLAIAQTYTESVGGTFRVGVDGDQFSAIVELPKTERNL